MAVVGNRQASSASRSRRAGLHNASASGSFASLVAWRTPVNFDPGALPGAVHSTGKHVGGDVNAPACDRGLDLILRPSRTIALGTPVVAGGGGGEIGRGSQARPKHEVSTCGTGRVPMDCAAQPRIRNCTGCFPRAPLRERQPPLTPRQLMHSMQLLAEARVLAYVGLTNEGCSSPRTMAAVEL